MSPGTPIRFTAAQIAAALGCKRQRVQQRLNGIPRDGVRIVNGVEGDEWSFAALPVPLQKDLEARAQQCGRRNALALLAEPPKVWQPRIPLSMLGADVVNRAAKLREVLEPLLRDDSRRTTAEFEAVGIASYARIFGHPISGRWLRDLFKRTLMRDGGAGDFHRLELYLDDNVGVAPRSKRAGVKQYDHSALADRLSFKNPARPTLTERQNALEYSFAHFETLVAMGGGRAEVKRSVVCFLHEAAPALARSQHALKRNWDRLYAKWKAGGEKPSAVADKRTRKAGGSHLAGLEGDLQLIVAEAWRHDGKLAIAIRKLRKAGKLSQDFLERYTLDVRRNKSYVARSIRQEITARLTGMLAHRRSQHQVNMEGPRIARSHDYRPGDYFAADDVTFNIYWWTNDDHGRPIVTRGECLLFFDCRSLYPLGYVLTPGKYNGETVRRGILNIHDKHGLPHRGFIFERGIWESRLIEGSRPKDFLAWGEYEMGLRERGLKLECRHATTPQGKLIEGIFNILEQNQRGLPGFVGFNERSYRQEELQKFIGRVRRGLVHPSEKLLSMEQWREQLDRSLEAYMHEPQNGQMLRGASPAEIFAEHQPLRRLPDDARFLLSTHRVRAKVKSNGIGIEIRGQRRFYYSQELGPFTGREVFAWFNIEEPDLLTISDLEMKTFLTVKRQVLPAFDATKEQLAEAHRERRGFMKPAQDRVDAIKHPIRRLVVRDNVIDAETQSLGAHIRRQTEQFETEKSEHERQLRMLDTVAEQSGVSLPALIRHPERARRGIELLNESAAEIASEHDGATYASKTYLLTESPQAKPSSTEFWKLWAQIEQVKPGLDRHAITRKTLQTPAGPNPSPNQMTAEQLSKMLDVFRAILRDASTPANV